jgi:Protein of unknown function (DUF1559)
MKRILFATLIVYSSLAAFAAPVPKDKEVEPPPATDKQRNQAVNNLKKILLAMHNYESATLALPADSIDQDGKPLLSWRVAALPYFNEDKASNLYKKFALDEPWDSKTNKPLIAEMPKVYAPVRVKELDGFTFYRGFSGNGAFFELGQKRTIIGITDGTSNSIAVIEAGEAVIWSKPDTDIPFDPNKPLPPLGKDIDGVFHAATLDGAVHRIRRDFDAEKMKAAITIAGGEVIEFDSLKPEKK